MAGLWRRLLRLRELTPVELQAEKYFDELGIKCPFRLAKYLGVPYSYTELGEYVGTYSNDPDNPERQRILLNESADIHDHENALFELMYHHIENPGIEKSFTEKELREAVKTRRRGTLWWL